MTPAKLSRSVVKYLYKVHNKTLPHRFHMRYELCMQYRFKAFKEDMRAEHGGDLQRGRRKLARPVATKTPMHVVLRASKARGEWSMLNMACSHRISALVVKYADKNDVRLIQFANSGNHLHLLVQAKTRVGFQRFLKTISGLIARLVTGAVKARPAGKFWDHLAYSRTVGWGRDLRTTVKYILQNTKEAFGITTVRKAGWKTGVKLEGFS